MNRKGRMIFVLIAVLAACGTREDRRIRLSRRPLDVLSTERVRAVKIAVEEKKRIAIPALKNETPETAPSWLGQGLADMLALTLSQSRRLNLMPGRTVHDGLARAGLKPEDLSSALLCRRAAAELRADAIITGRYRRVRDSLTVELTVWDGLSGERLGVFQTAAAKMDVGSLFRMIHMPAGSIRTLMEKENDQSVVHEKTPTFVTTNSLEAYRLYSEGLALLEGVSISEAAQKFTEAVEIDSTFASACMRLALCQLMFGRQSAAKPLLRQALRHSAHLPERERLPILALHARVNGDYNQAVRYYEQYIALFPEDVQGHYQLGEYYFGVLRDYRRAIGNLETVISLDSNYKSAYNLLAYSYAMIGEMDRALDALDRYVELAPTEANPLDSYGEILQGAGRIEEAIEKYRAALKKDPRFVPAKLHLVSAYLDLGKTRQARKILRNKVFNDKDIIARRGGLKLQVWTEIVSGNISRAEQLLRSVQPPDPEDSLWMTAVLLLLNPESEEHRRLFIGLVEKESARIADPDYSPDRLFQISAVALEHRFAFAEVSRLLYQYLQHHSSPLAVQIVLAYAGVFQLYGVPFFERPELFPGVNSLHKEYQSMAAVAWDYYWKYYFAGLHRAQAGGGDVLPATTALAEFARRSGSPSMQTTALLAQAAAAHLRGKDEEAEKIFNQIGMPLERDWLILGPFEVREGFHQRFWPEEHEIKEWAKADKEPKPRRGGDSRYDGYVDLHEIIETRFNQAAYAALQIYSPTRSKLVLSLGSNARLKIWMNGEPVSMINRIMPAVIDHDRVPIRLKQGLNTLLIRLDAPIGELGFYCRFIAPSGEAAEDLLFGDRASAIAREKELTR